MMNALAVVLAAIVGIMAAVTVSVTTLLGIAAAVVAPLGAYLIAVRRFSGKIGSSDAAELWEESRSIRDWSERRITYLEQKMADLSRENIELLKEVSTLRAQVSVLTNQLAHSHALIKELENSNEH